MFSAVTSGWRSRTGWCAAIVVVILLPALAALPTALVPALVAALSVAAALLRWTGRRGRVRAISFRTAAGLAIGASLLTDVAYAGPHTLALFWLPVELGALCLLVGRAVRVLAERAAAVVGALAALAATLLPLRLVLWAPIPEHRLAVLLAFSIAFLLPAGFAAAVGLYLRALDNRRRDAVVTARRDQRLQVAHDLHDWVAHELTGIVIEAQAAQVGRYDTDQTSALMQRIEAAGLRALDSMDDTLRALREAEDGDAGRPRDQTVRLYGLADLPELLERFGGGDGAPHTELRLPARLPELTREADGVGYALVLEALTNIRRHAPNSTRVAVAVGLRPDGRLEVRVSDDGGAAKPVSNRRTGGTGLVGLDDRLAALGGSLTAGPASPTGEGWVVCGVLPV